MRKRLEIIEKKIDDLTVTIDKSKLKDYADLMNNPKKLIYTNFLAGLAKGFGAAIGFSVLAGLAFYIFASFVNLPVIGAYIAKLLDIIEHYR